MVECNKKNQSVYSKVPVILLLMMVLSLWNGCYYDHGLSTSDYDVVITYYDQEVDFSQFSTYTLPDSIVHIVTDNDQPEISRNFDQLIINQVVANMNDLNYIRNTSPQVNPPDLAMVIAVTSSNNFQAIYNYSWGGYWGYYGYGWGGGYGIYYPPYWWGGGVVNYETGTILILMIDPARTDEGSQLLGAIWAGTINGLLGDSPASVQTRLTNEINQAFRQSPYLGAAN